MNRRQFRVTRTPARDLGFRHIGDDGQDLGPAFVQPSLKVELFEPAAGRWVEVLRPDLIEEALAEEVAAVLAAQQQDDERAARLATLAAQRRLAEAQLRAMRAAPGIAQPEAFEPSIAPRERPEDEGTLPTPSLDEAAIETSQPEAETETGVASQRGAHLQITDWIVVAGIAERWVAFSGAEDERIERRSEFTAAIVMVTRATEHEVGECMAAPVVKIARGRRGRPAMRDWGTLATICDLLESRGSSRAEQARRRQDFIEATASQMGVSIETVRKSLSRHRPRHEILDRFLRH